jgi:hypothetical protein
MISLIKKGKQSKQRYELIDDHHKTTWELLPKYHLLGYSLGAGFNNDDVDAEEADAVDNWLGLTVSIHVPHESVPAIERIAADLAHIPLGALGRI